MAVMHGKGGTVAFTGFTSLATSWTITGDVPMARATDLGDTYETYLPGIKNFSISVESNLDSAGLAITILGTTAVLTLDTVSGKSYAITGSYCNNVSINDTMDDTVKCTLSFQGGTLAENA